MVLVVAAAIMGLLSGPAFGDGEPLVQVTNSESKTVPVEDLGTGNFTRFPFHVSASVRGGYDDNITTTSIDPQESWFTNAAVALTYDFGSPRTQLSLQTGGGATFYWDDPDEFDDDDEDYDVNAYISLVLKHKASPRLTFDVTAYATYQTEPDFTLALGLNRRSGNFFFTQDRFTTTYLWTPRFATATSYTFAALQYDDDEVGLFEDRIENTFGNEFKFLLWPTTSLVAEYRFQLVNYSNEGDVIVPEIPATPLQIIFDPNTGLITIIPPHRRVPARFLERDSTTHYVLVGFDHSFSPRFSASFRGGAQFRDYSDANEDDDQDQSSPYFEGTLNYALGKNTSVSWTARYAIEEGDVLFNPSRTTFRTGLRVKHDFTQRITANLGAYYEHDDYDDFINPSVFSPGFTDEAFDVAVSMRYAITRHFGIEAGFNHTEVWSDIHLREYSRNRYWGGLNVVF